MERWIHGWIARLIDRYIGDICFFFSVKVRNLFHLVDTIGNIFTSGCTTCENITDGVHEMKEISIFHRKQQIFCSFHAFNPFWEKLYQNPVQFFSLIPCGVPLPHSNAL